MEIINKDGFNAVRCSKTAVAVILYTLDESGLLDQIGIVTEKNPHFKSGSYSGLVMGGVEADDTSLLSRAKIETKEESGYDVIENERWTYLGELFTSKIIPEPIYCYSADVTGLDASAPKGDGSEHESTIQFDLIDLAKIRNINDSIVQSCFFKLFSKLYNKEFA